MSKRDFYSQFFFSQNNLQILQELEKSQKPMQFKELREIKNPTTKKKFSSSTIASKIKLLEEQGILENQIVQARSKKVLGYVLTENGRAALKILRETQTKLEKL